LVNGQCHTLRIPAVNEEICGCWYDEITTSAIFSLHLEPRPLLAKVGKWKLEVASVSICRRPKKKRIGKCAGGCLRNLKAGKKEVRFFLIPASHDPTKAFSTIPLWTNIICS
jgi:hypothetical protein